MKCLLCGKELPENAKFCDSCGARVSIGNQNSGASDLKVNTFNSVDGVSNANSSELNITGLNNQVSDYNNINETTNNSIDKVELTSNGINSQNNTNNTNDSMSTNGSFNNFIGPGVETINAANINNQNVMNNNGNVASVSTPKKKKNKAPIIVIIIIFVLAILATVAWLFINKKTSTKTIFVDGFKNVSEKLLLTTDDYKSTTSTLKFNLNVNDNSSLGIINILNNLSLDFSVNRDDDNKVIDTFVKANYEGKQALNINVYGNNDSLYLYLAGLYDKYIKLPVSEEEYSKLFQTDTSSNKALKEGLDKAFEAALKDEYLSKSTETIRVNGTDTKVNANRLTLNEKTFKQFASDFTKALREDTAFLKALSSMLDTDIETIKAYLTVDSSTDFAENSVVEFTIYTKGVTNSFAGFAMNIKEASETVSISVLKVDESNYELSITQGSTTIGGKLTIVKNGDTEKLSFSISAGSNTIGFTIDTKYSKKAIIETKDVSGAVSFEEFSQNGAIDVQNNMMKNETLVKLIQDIMTEVQGISSSSTYGDFEYQLDDDYTSDYGVTDSSSLLY